MNKDWRRDRAESGIGLAGAKELLATQRSFHSAQLQISEMQMEQGHMQMQSEQMQLHATHLEASLEQARGRIDELENSRAWKMTAPLRNAGHRLKVARARFHAWRAGVRRLPQLSSMALSNVALWSAAKRIAALAPAAVVLGGGGYNPWTVTRYWTGLWGTLSGRTVPALLLSKSISTRMWPIPCITIWCSTPQD